MLGAVYLINRTPSRLLHSKTPYECLFGVPHYFDEIKVFGSLYFAYNQHEINCLLESSSCAFVGYPNHKRDGSYISWKLMKFLFLVMSSFFRMNFLLLIILLLLLSRVKTK